MRSEVPSFVQARYRWVFYGDFPGTGLVEGADGRASSSLAVEERAVLVVDDRGGELVRASVPSPGVRPGSRRHR
ncbi:MAG: hypothetical protein ACRDQU_16530 [Pseudonocardiaceae bacterium]